MAHETGFRLHNIGGSGTLVGLDMADQAQKTDPSGELGYTPFDAADVDTDGTLAANSDLLVASQKATKTYVDTALSNISIGEAPIVWRGTNFVTSSSVGQGYSLAFPVLCQYLQIPPNTMQPGDEVWIRGSLRTSGSGTGYPFFMLTEGSTVGTATETRGSFTGYPAPTNLGWGFTTLYQIGAAGAYKSWYAGTGAGYASMTNVFGGQHSSTIIGTETIPAVPANGTIDPTLAYYINTGHYSDATRTYFGDIIIVEIRRP